MRTLALAVLTACAHPAPAPEVAPRGPTPCEHASDTMVQLLLDRMADKEHVPTEQADKIRNLIRERCDQDQWSAEATTCLAKMTKLEDADACGKLMTDAQQAALVADENTAFPAAKPAPEPAVAAPASPAPAAAPAAESTAPAPP